MATSRRPFRGRGRGDTSATVKEFIHDAWNRLIEYTEPQVGNRSEVYVYNGLN